MIHGVTVKVQKVKTKWFVVTMETVLFMGFTFSVLISEAPAKRKKWYCPDCRKLPEFQQRVSKETGCSKLILCKSDI